jgi:hypothetical protein
MDQILVVILDCVNILFRPMLLDVAAETIQYIFDERPGWQFANVSRHDRRRYNIERVVVSVSPCLHSRSFQNDSQCKQSDLMDDFRFRRIVKPLKHVAYPLSLIMHMIANRSRAIDQSPWDTMVPGSTPSNNPSSNERAPIPLHNLPTNDSISWRCCDKTKLRACSIVNAVASVSKTGRKDAARIHQLSVGA